MILNSKWISYSTGEATGPDAKYGNPSPYFRHTFSIKTKPSKAILSISALGVFKAYINGSAVSNDYLSPGWVDYSKQLPLIRYEITGILKYHNAIGIVLGDGWAVGHLGSNYTFKREGYSNRIEFTATIYLEYPDGTSEEIITDENWKATQGAIRRSDIYMGEYVDARQNLGNFSLPEYDDSGWDYAYVPKYKFSRNLYLKEAVNPLTVVKHTFVPTLVCKNGNTWLYDVSQNISGVLKCVFRGSRDTKIVVRHGELIVDNKLYTENLRKAEATDTYILSGEGEELFRPLFTYHGFRFAEITIYGEAEIVDILAEVMYTDLESTGSFSCSDHIVNKIYQNSLWGQRDNFINVPTDCPQRDERLGWTGDTQIFCKSAMYNMDCKVFYKKYLMDVRDAQLGNGVIPAVAPMPPVGFYDYCGRDCAAGWAESIAEIPYYHYLMYGDRSIIRDNLPALKRLLDYYEVESPDYIRNGFKQYGDWLSVGADTDLSVVATLYYARAAYVARELCAVLHDFEESRYDILYNKIRNAFRERFMDAEGVILSDTQSCYLIAYAFGIITREEAFLHLKRKLLEDNGHLTSGFLGIKFLLPTLCEIGLSEDAYRIITSTDFPGWGYSVCHGATTIWEHWDSYTVENGIRDGMNSFNHYSFGSCTEWMYEYCLGIKPHFNEPGFAKVTFRPYLDCTGKITWAKGHYDTHFGRITVEWKCEKDIFTYIVTVPDKIEISFDFPGLKQICYVTEKETHYFELKSFQKQREK